MIDTNVSSATESRILAIDDDPDILDLMKGMLRSLNVQVSAFTDSDKAIEHALHETPDLILLDHDMPGANGLQVFQSLLTNGIPASVPVVFVTGSSNHGLLTECFRAGAVDYIRKPFCASELCARVGSILERKRILGQLEQMAHYDPLTQLNNRASIRDKIQAEIDGPQTERCGLLFIDFDRFKLVNDSLGHDAGDELLKHIAKRLMESLRQNDSIGRLTNQTTVARLGGDEFVILLEGLRDTNDAARVADRLVHVLETPYQLVGRTISCTASIGVVNHLTNTATADEALRDADIAMYEAKAAGRGRYVVFHTSMHAAATQRLRIENELRNAIERDELVVEYQPLVVLETGRTEGFEALVRWQHPQQGLISPGVFLPVAEESGLIVPLGFYVLKRACRDFARWQNELGDAAPSKIHVNVARKQLMRDLVTKVKHALREHAVAPESLHLEVTENEIMQDPSMAHAVLQELRELGVRIDMDDFGTGHSSLACLQELPVDVIKIDRSFIANMERSRSFAALVHAVITLGQNLGMTVVAEGIETAEQLAMLQFMECESGQGYFFSKSMPASAVPSYLLARHNARVNTPEVACPGTCDSVRWN